MVISVLDVNSPDREAPAVAGDPGCEWLQGTLEVTQSLLGDAGEKPLAAVARVITQLAKADFVLVILPTADDALMVELAVGDGTEYLPGYTYARTGSIADAVLRIGEPALVPDARHSTSAALRTLSEEIHVGPVMCIPLTGQNRARGVLVVGRRSRREPFDEQDVAPAVAFANHATLALELADGRMYQQRLALLEERERIAGDLHDQVLQRLFATGMSMQAIAGAVDRRLAEQLEDLIGATDETIARIRSVIQDLNSSRPDCRVL